MVEIGPIPVMIETLLLPIFFIPLLIKKEGITVAIIASAIAYQVSVVVNGISATFLSSKISSIFLDLVVLPITAINSLFEQKSWKYILVTSGYWMVSLTIMGAIICGWK